MPTALFEKTTRIPASPEELYRWHARPGAFARLVPPWERIGIEGPAAEVADGSRMVLRMRKGPLSVRWVAEHRNVRPGRAFEDVQIAGPFKLWEHLHEFVPDGDGAILRDRIRHRLPGGPLGALVAGRSIRSDLERTFRYRHATTRADLALHGRFVDREPLAVAVSGAGGLIGGALTALLSTGGHRVVRLVRKDAGAGPGEAAWDPARGLVEPAKLEGIDAVVHLAGENLASGRWTRAKRERIRASRIEGTRNLVESLGRLGRPPRVFVAASAVGVYGDRGDEALDESIPPGEGFLAEVCREWEAAAAGAGGFDARTVSARLGVVLSPAGGMLAKLLTPFRLGLGGVVGNGRQVVSWISIDDAIAALLWLLMDSEISGPVNLTAPAPASNRELTRTLGRVLRRPTLAPVPAWAARLAFGRMANETVLSSARALPARLEAAGFEFRHPDLETALRHVLGRHLEGA